MLRTGGAGEDGCEREDGARAHRNAVSIAEMRAFHDGTRILVGLHWRYDALKRFDMADIVAMASAVCVGPFGPPYTSRHDDFAPDASRGRGIQS